jgi:hypothetical protein
MVTRIGFRKLIEIKRKSSQECSSRETETNQVYKGKSLIRGIRKNSNRFCLKD